MVAMAQKKERRERLRQTNESEWQQLQGGYYYYMSYI